MDSTVMDLAAFDEKAEDAAILLRALANPQRLKIVCVLTKGEYGVTEIENLTGVRQPSLSRELSRLREAGLVEGRRESKAVFYSLVDARAAAVLAAVCDRQGPARMAGKGRRAGPAAGGGSHFARIFKP